MRLGSLISPDTETYYKYYSAQVGGGQLAGFQGSRYQEGDGFGDILRGFARHVVPIIAPVASSFLSSLLQGHTGGMSWKDSAREALPEAVANLGRTATSHLMQSGRGRRKKKRSKGYKRRKNTKSKKRHVKKIKTDFVPTNF